MTVTAYKETDIKKIEQYTLLPNSGKNICENGGAVYVFHTSKEIVFTFECPYTQPLKLPYTAYNDPVWRGEAVEVFISPNADMTHYFEFDAAPNGSSYNAQVLNVGDPTVFVRSIDNCPVIYDSKINDDFYTLEMRIPFSLILKKGTSPSDVPWLFNAYRISHADSVRMFALSPTAQNSFHVPSKFSELNFM